MSTSYVEESVKKIIKEDGHSYPLNLAMASVWIMANLKAINLKIFDVRGKSPLADYYVLGSVTNSIQAQSTADQLSRHLKGHGASVKSKEGTGESDWMLIDLGDIMIHIFLDHAREVFDLDNLWSDSTQVEIPSEYYHSEREVAAEDESSENYF